MTPFEWLLAGSVAAAGVLTMVGLRMLFAVARKATDEAHEHRRLMDDLHGRVRQVERELASDARRTHYRRAAGLLKARERMDRELDNLRARQQALLERLRGALDDPRCADDPSSDGPEHRKA